MTIAKTILSQLLHAQYTSDDIVFLLSPEGFASLLEEESADITKDITHYLGYELEVIGEQIEPIKIEERPINY